MNYQIELIPRVNRASDRNRLAIVWVNNSTWNGGGGRGGTLRLSPAYRVGRIGFGTVEVHSSSPQRIDLYEQGGRGTPLVALFFNSPPILYLGAFGTGSCYEPGGGRLPVGDLDWRVISVS